MLYGYGKHGEAYCRCICECGTEVIKGSYDLRHPRNPPHCGCMTTYYKYIQSANNRVDLVGQRFGSLVVTEMIYEYKKHTRVRCKCDCGNEIVRIATYLTSGNTTSCGCVQKQMASKSNTKDFAGVISDYGIEFLSRARQTEKGCWLWRCRCQCGNEFIALPAKILNGHTTSCGCARISSGERLIRSILDEIDVKYIPEYKFEECRDVLALPFDFYLVDYNAVIEYQGIQHYRPVEIFNGDDGFRIVQMHDSMKRAYCESQNIRLIEVPYTLSPKDVRNKLINTIYP